MFSWYTHTYVCVCVCVCITKSLFFTPETNTSLLINHIPIKKIKKQQQQQMIIEWNGHILEESAALISVSDKNSTQTDLSINKWGIYYLTYKTGPEVKMVHDRVGLGAQQS